MHLQAQRPPVGGCGNGRAGGRQRRQRAAAQVWHLSLCVAALAATEASGQYFAVQFSCTGRRRRQMMQQKPVGRQAYMSQAAGSCALIKTRDPTSPHSTVTSTHTEQRAGGSCNQE